jgi:hypothetical protein
MIAVETQSHPRTSYTDWNAAIVDYVTDGVAPGGAVYLGIDDRALAVIADRLLGLGPISSGSARDCFLGAVRSWCGASAGTVVLPAVEDIADVPNGVAFLAAQVLAAHDMDDDVKGSSWMYFGRLGDVLGVELNTQRRPSGLDILPKQPAPEEAHWLRWNSWLRTHGWEPTASRGEGRWTYLYYPLSQALLRRTDQQRLMTLLLDHASDIDRGWDREQFAARLPRLALRLPPSRLRGLLLNEEADAARWRAVVDAAYDIFLADWVSDEQETPRSRPGPARLEAGLYRYEDFTGEPRYLLYPRVPRLWGDRPLRLRLADGPVELPREAHRPNWFRPAPEAIDPTAERRLEVLGEAVSWLSFAPRDCRVLVPDPLGADDGMAGWGPPQPDDAFIILCRSSVLPTLKRLEEEGFLGWDEVFPLAEGWCEVVGCRLSRLDSENVPEEVADQEIVGHLWTRGVARTGLSGGLKVPGSGAWLEGHLPRLTVYGPEEEEVAYSVRAGGEVLADGQARVGEPVALPHLGPGAYEIEAGGATRSFRVVAWGELRPAVRAEV